MAVFAIGRVLSVNIGSEGSAAIFKSKKTGKICQAAWKLPSRIPNARKSLSTCCFGFRLKVWVALHRWLLLAPQGAREHAREAGSGLVKLEPTSDHFDRGGVLAVQVVRGAITAVAMAAMAANRRTRRLEVAAKDVTPKMTHHLLHQQKHRPFEPQGICKRAQRHPLKRLHRLRQEPKHREKWRVGSTSAALELFMHLPRLGFGCWRGARSCRAAPLVQDRRSESRPFRSFSLGEERCIEDPKGLLYKPSIACCAF